LSHHLEALIAHVRAGALNRPGIYRFLGPRGEVLYVGKTVRVRARLLSWLRHGAGDRGWEMLRVTRAIDWEYAPTEFEALLREFRLIRALRPRHNVHHRRERRFAWVGLTGGPAPRLQAVRSPARCCPTGKGTTLFGPFPAYRNLPRLLRQLSRLQGIRDCPDATPLVFADQFDLLPDRRPALCPRGDSGSCMAPCAARCTEEEYRSRVRDTAAFLRGECERPLRTLARRAAAASARRDHAVAARLRDAEDELRHLRDDIVSFHRMRESLTFIYRVPVAEGSHRCYLLRRGLVRLVFDDPVVTGRSGGHPDPATRSLSASVAGQVQAVLSGPDPEDALMSAEEREELFLTTRWFRDRPEEMLRTESPEEWLARPGTPVAPGGSLPVQPIPDPPTRPVPE